MRVASCERRETADMGRELSKEPLSARHLSLAVIGDFGRSDFPNVVRDIRAKTAAICFDNLALFLCAGGLTQNYDLVFLLESGFMQYSSRDIRHLQSCYPLARIVMVAGSLAEGERRTGTLPPELIRYYWHQWETEALPAFMAFCNHCSSSWGLPTTTSEEERLGLVASCELRVASGEQHGHKYVIVADDPAMRELLVDWVTQQGFEAAAFGQFHFQESVDVVAANEIFFDVASENFAETLATVQFLKKQWPSARLTVLYTAPRTDETRMLTHSGANRIIAKPFFLP